MTNLFKKKLFVFALSLIILLVLLLSVYLTQQGTRYQIQAAGNPYYVATNGSDSSPGTLSQPWRTIQYAVNQVNAGDTIFVREGTYDEGVVVTVSGQEGAPITLMNYQNEVVTIDGGSYAALTDRSSTQYWIIDGFNFDSDVGLTLDLGAWGWCETRNWIVRNNYIIGSIGIVGSYNTVEGNNIDGSQHKGSEFGIREWTEVSHHNLYKNNEIHDFYNRAIWSMYFTHDSVFEGNHIWNSGSQGIDLDGYTTCVWRHQVVGNHIHHSTGGNAIALENAYDTLVENNIVHDNTKWGIALINYGGEPAEPGQEFECRPDPSNQYGDTDGDNDCRADITNNIVRQNLIYNMGFLGAINIWNVGGVSVLGNTISGVTNGAGIHIGNYAPDITIKNNIVENCDWGTINVQSTDSLVVDSNNMLFQEVAWKGHYRISDVDYKLADYQSMTGKGQNSIAGDPLFVNSPSGDFSLLANSPAIDAGIDIGLATDLDGESRPQGLDYDIGVYEYLVGGPQPTITPTITPVPSPTPTPPVHCLPLGDVDCSGKINSLDFSYLIAHYNTSDSKADLDNSGEVNALDVFILLANFGQSQ